VLPAVCIETRPSLKCLRDRVSIHTEGSITLGSRAKSKTDTEASVGITASAKMFIVTRIWISISDLDLRLSLSVVRERGLSSGSVGLARWLFGDSNTVVSSRWGLGGLRHFSGALRPFRHSSRGLPSGSAIRCPSSLRCAGAHYSGFVGRASSMWLLGEYGIFLFCSPRFWVVGVFLRALSSSGGYRFPHKKKPDNPKSWGAEQKDPILPQ